MAQRINSNAMDSSSCGLLSSSLHGLLDNKRKAIHKLLMNPEINLRNYVTVRATGNAPLETEHVPMHVLCSIRESLSLYLKKPKVLNSGCMFLEQFDHLIVSLRGCRSPK
jgi:hypothetical protein